MLQTLIRESVEDAVKKYLDENIESLVKQTNQNRLLDMDEAAEILNVSKKWIYKNAHKLPFAIKLSDKMWRFDPKKLQAYLNQAR